MYRNRKEIFEIVYDNLKLNANTIKCSQCYAKCANKNKLAILEKLENQVVFGRRGTGKTTIFKAFAYYINKIKEDNSCKAWYISIDDCLPDSELIDLNENMIVRYTVKKFLKKFIDFLCLQYDKLSRIKYGNIIDKYNDYDYLLKLLCELDDLVFQGSPIEKTNEGEYYEGLVKIRKKGMNMSLSSKNKGIAFSSKLGYEREREKKQEQTRERKVEYSLDILEIKETVYKTIKAFGYEKFYICLDEFNLIDRDITCSIQTKFAQVIKELFFGSDIIVVKIANVWNEARMQSRQVGGIRQGLELGNDIFSNDNLDLDIMFEWDNEKAYNFFSNMILNDYILGTCETVDNEEKRSKLKQYILEEMFAKDALDFLICGSQGVPRMFGDILAKCIDMSKKEDSKKITAQIVSQGIINHYTTKIRQRIPNSSPLCKAINKYIDSTKNRFFLVSIDEYNKGVNFFDGLVAQNALHQVPSAQIPRVLRDEYKVFIVHYGNYLDAFGQDPLKIIMQDAKYKNNNMLYMEFPEDLLEDADRYILDIPENAYETIYCNKCHRYFNMKRINKTEIIVCPECKDIIAYWR